MIVRSIRKEQRGEVILKYADGIQKDGNNKVLGYYY